jgi:hypothetical protein
MSSAAALVQAICCLLHFEPVHAILFCFIALETEFSKLTSSLGGQKYSLDFGNTHFSGEKLKVIAHVAQNWLYSGVYEG